MTDAAAPPYADDRPLFILGCVRSGTTLTRDLLRRVPGFICPEETHFLRWAEPFRTPHGLRQIRQNKLLVKHREIDGVAPDRFEEMLTTCRSKDELIRTYITAFAAAQGITGPYRWFEKTPQNVYAAPLLAQLFPKARFLHLVRNPLNVAASLILGRQVKVPDIHGACNFWLEAVEIVATLKAAYPERVLELRYEDLIADVPGHMAAILHHADVAAPEGLYSAADAHSERNLWRSALDAAQRGIVVARCGPQAERLGYDLAAMVARRRAWFAGR